MGTGGGDEKGGVAEKEVEGGGVRVCWVKAKSGKGLDRMVVEGLEGWGIDTRL